MLGGRRGFLLTTVSLSPVIVSSFPLSVSSFLSTPAAASCFLLVPVAAFWPIPSAALTLEVAAVKTAATTTAVTNHLMSVAGLSVRDEGLAHSKDVLGEGLAQSRDAWGESLSESKDELALLMDFRSEYQK